MFDAEWNIVWLGRGDWRDAQKRSTESSRRAEAVDAGKAARQGGKAARQRGSEAAKGMQERAVS